MLWSRHRLGVRHREQKSGQFRAVDVWYGSDQRLSVHTSGLQTPPVDEIEGKRQFGRRDAWSEDASPALQPVWSPTLSSTDGSEEMSVRYAAAYFVGSLTVRRRRPFLRRRLRTSRPHFVSIRVRKPWVRMRRLFRGRYVGLPMHQTPEIGTREQDSCVWHAAGFYWGKESET